MARGASSDPPHDSRCGPHRAACSSPIEYAPAPSRHRRGGVPRLLLLLAVFVALPLRAQDPPPPEAVPEPAAPPPREAVTESFDSAAGLQGWHAFSGRWAIVDGACRETSEDYRTVSLRSGRFYDFDLAVTMSFLHVQRRYPMAGYGVVILRAQDARHYYAVVARQNGALELSEYTSTPTGARAMWQPIAAAGGEQPERALYVAHALQIQCRATQITASIFPADQEPPEEPMLKGDVSKKGAFDHFGGKAYLAGRVGFGSSNATVSFDDLSIQPVRATAELVDRLTVPRELVQQVADRGDRRSEAQAAKAILGDMDKLRGTLRKLKAADDEKWQEAEAEIESVVGRAKEVRKQALLARGGFRAVSPYAGLSRFRLYRGNLHCYTRHSSGALHAEAAAKLYQEAGYHFVAFTDNDAYGDQDGGVLFPQHQNDEEAHDWNGDGVVNPRRTYRSGKEAYVRDYTKPSPPWVDKEWDLHRSGSFVVFDALESSFGHPAIGCIGHPPGPIVRPRESYAFAERVRGAGGLLVLHNPSGWNTAPESIYDDEDLRGLDALEVYNGAYAGRTIRPGNEDGHEGFAEPLWNACLDAGVAFWGLANDGTHSYDENGGDRPFNGHNMVWASELTRIAILDAIKAGRFYASCGVVVDSIRVTESAISVASENATRIRVVGYGGEELKVVEGGEMTYEMDGSERWIRVELENDERVLPDKPYHQKAWLQPMFVEELLMRRT